MTELLFRSRARVSAELADIELADIEVSGCLPLRAKSGQPRDQGRRGAAKDGGSLVVGEFGAGLDVLAVADGQSPNGAPVSA
jgi:hypothetical protein